MKRLLAVLIGFGVALGLWVFTAQPASATITKENSWTKVTADYNPSTNVYEGFLYRKTGSPHCARMYRQKMNGSWVQSGIGEATECGSTQFPNHWSIGSPSASDTKGIRVYEVDSSADGVGSHLDVCIGVTACHSM